ncbi:hypothetical protein V495_05331 [Pseudogymnoascus sp. VKM F-4514 (FW-929)]|nr:hypothetical protein V495_05331 [Pseudogymnoascus sp. VKM F-4514 (FW-929)]KFY52188.1 hypothetical protein V497_08609 [Pseudogymnoascus sp. VKM F-4516 (FW-969)]
MIGDVVIPFAPAEVSAPWSIVKAVMKIPVMQAEQICALLGTVEVIVRIIRRGQVYEALYTADTVEDDAAFENFQGALLKVYVAAIELLAESDALFSKGMARQTFHAIVHPSKGTGLASDLFKAEQKLALDVQPCEAICRRKNNKSINSKVDNLLNILLQLDPQLTRIDTTVNELLEKLNETEQEKLRDFISPVPFRDAFETVEGSRTLGTGEWLLAHASFREWECIRSSSTLLLLEGNSGTGKTFLTSKVIEYVSDKLEGSPNHEGFAYFFCKKGVSLMDPLIVLRSFVRQLSRLANDSDNFQKDIVKECKNAKSKGSSGLNYNKCKDLIIKSVNIYPKTTLVLDAFDESDSSNKNLIETLIEIMDKSTRPVKVFVSSRTGREITELFKTTPTITINAKNDIDIEILLDEVYDEGWYKKLYLENPSLQLEISQTFASRSLGMIRWVYLQVNRLRRCTTHGSIKETLKSLPKDLTESYDMSYKEIRQNGDTDLVLAERAIKWVMVSYHALGADALLEAVRVMPQGMELEGGTRQKILTLCEDFLTLDKQRNVWELSHASVGEYFESKHWSGEVANLFVAQASLTLLNDAYTLADAESVREYIYGKKRYDRPKNRQPRSNDITPILVYASHHWPLHVQRYETGIKPGMEVNAELSHLLKRFLGSPGFSSQQYRTWASFIITSRLMPPNYPKTSPFNKIHSDGFTPSDVALFIMCQFGIYYLLVDWWMGDSINGACMKTTSCGYNALSCAARGGSKSICERLVTQIDVNFPLGDDVYCTVLIDAIAHHQVEIAKFLIADAGAIVETPAWGHYNSALAAAAAHSPLEFVEWLTEQGHVHIDLLTETSSSGNPLQKAIMHGRTEIVKYLLQKGASANALFLSGTYGSALATASSEKTPNTEMIKDLIKYGAVPDLPTPGEYGSALACAAFYGNIENMEALISGGANVNLRLSTGDYGSALAAAACGLNNAEATRWLISKKADVNQDLGTYGSALVASICFRKSLVKDSTMVLLDAGAMGTAVLPEGTYSSGLAAAAFWGHVDLLKLMVERETPSVALETLRHSRTPPTSVLEIKVMIDQKGFITKSQISDREEAALYLPPWTYFSDGAYTRRTLHYQLAPYQCCEAPPSPSSFTTVRVTTDGVYGIVVFTYINNNYDCGDCQFGGILNKCHDNRTPFNISYVAPVRVCGNVSRHRRALDSLAGAMEKQPLSDNTGGKSECTKSVRPHIAGVDGNEYDMSGLTDPEREDLVDDLINMESSQFHSKWAHIYSGPAPQDGAATVNAPAAPKE